MAFCQIRSLFLLLMLASQRAPMATVKFVVLDEFGEALPYAVKALVHWPTGEDFAGAFAGTERKEIPLGSYQVVLERPGDTYGAARIKADVYVRGSTSFVFYGESDFIPGVAVTSMAPTGYGFNIRVQGGVPGGLPTRVRVLSLTNRKSVECVLDEKSECTIREYLRGLYQLVVTRGAEVLHAETLRIKSSSITIQHEVRLSDHRGKTLDVH